MKHTLQTMQQHMVMLFWNIARTQEAITIDGVPGYNEKAQFVGGKVINFCCYVVLEILKDTDDYDRSISSVRCSTFGDCLRFRLFCVIVVIIGVRCRVGGALPFMVPVKT